MLTFPLNAKFRDVVDTRKSWFDEIDWNSMFWAKDIRCQSRAEFYVQSENNAKDEKSDMQIL